MESHAGIALSAAEDEEVFPLSDAKQQFSHQTKCLFTINSRVHSVPSYKYLSSEASYQQALPPELACFGLSLPLQLSARCMIGKPLQHLLLQSKCVYCLDSFIISLHKSEWIFIKVIWIWVRQIHNLMFHLTAVNVHFIFKLLLRLLLGLKWEMLILLHLFRCAKFLSFWCRQVNLVLSVHQFKFFQGVWYITSGIFFVAWCKTDLCQSLETWTLAHVPLGSFLLKDYAVSVVPVTLQLRGLFELMLVIWLYHLNYLNNSFVPK